jgi:hypothetical protein
MLIPNTGERIFLLHHRDLEKTAITNLHTHLKNQHHCIMLAEMEGRGFVSHKNDIFVLI